MLPSRALLQTCVLWFLSVLIGFICPISADEYFSLAKEGLHVCHKKERYQRPVVVAIRESYKKIDYIPCHSFIKWFMCTKSRLYYRVSYRQEVIPAHRTIRGCCPGFVQNGTHCSPCIRGTYGPNCSRTCPECLNGFGTCTPRDGTCTCLDGYHGDNCDKGCRRGWYGKNCRHKCNCPKYHMCNRITGDCHCRHRRCSIYETWGRYGGGGADKGRGHDGGTGVKGGGDGYGGYKDRMIYQEDKILTRTAESSTAYSQYQRSSFLISTLCAVTVYYIHRERT